MLISISTWTLVQCYLNLTLDLVWSVLLISCYCDFPTRMDYNLPFKAQISSSPQAVFMRVLYSIGKQNKANRLKTLLPTLTQSIILCQNMKNTETVAPPTMGKQKNMFNSANHISVVDYY